MSQPEIYATLQRVFDDLFIEPVRLHPTLTAADVAEWDSLMQTSLVVAIERAFRVRFRMGEVERAANVGALVELIATHLAAAQGTSAGGAHP